MRKREGGQAFILVLILLAIGVLLVVPALRLTDTSLRSSQIVTRQAKALYAADAAQEYVLWRLAYDNWGEDFTTADPEGYAFLDCCGVGVNITVIMRAVVGQGGMILAGADVIQPTKSVSPDTILNDATQPVTTYTIRLEQLSANTSQGLDAIYDILPDVWDYTEYIANSSYVRVGEGEWVSVPDPAIEAGPSRWRLKWPADYDPDTSANPFSSDPEDPNYFNGMRDFTVRQVKELKFQMGPHTFSGEDKNRVHCNWVVLKPWNTLSGPQAPITVGDPANPGVCDNNGLLEVGKTSNPDIIPPGVETPIDYTVSITNQDGFTHQIQEITDYLPPDFEYTGPVTGFTTSEPQQDLVEVNGLERWKLYWEFSPAISVAAADTETMTFGAKATKDVSGSYFNEIFVVSDVPIPAIFADIGITPEDYLTSYSWNTGMVTVPTYDSRGEAEGVIIDANMALLLESVSITSYQVR